MKNKIFHAVRITVFFLITAALSLTISFPAQCEETAEKKDFIKWVDFTPRACLMKKLIDLDTAYHNNQSGVKIKWIEALSYLAARCGGDFTKCGEKQLNAMLDALKAGKTIDELASGIKLYPYYLEAYTAALDGFVGEYEVEAETSENGLAGKNGAETMTPENGRVWEKQYGLRNFHPIAKGYEYSDFDDFGTGRSFGYKRKHLGHDLMSLVGTPVIASESGIVEELGWNRYGGWRVGIRSFDGKRYWYYAHMRKNRPYAEGLERGKTVMAGDVIGYVGRTGYSDTENTNGIEQSHLHWGLQLIFDESQKDGNNQIWLDMYELTRLLSARRCETIRNPETKEHTRALGYRETVPETLPQIPEAAPEAAPAIPEAVPVTVTDEGTIKLPILMYHSILKDMSRQGTYVLTPWQFESDMKYLSEHGYTAVTVSEIVDFVESSAPLPDKPVLITFDDGHYDNFYYCDELLRKYNMKAVIFIIGTFSNRSFEEGVLNPNYSYVTPECMSQMAQGAVWEIQSHGYDVHSSGPRFGVTKKPGESQDNYEQALYTDFIKISEYIETSTGRAPTAFAYPFGATDDTAERILRELGIKLTVCSYEGIAEVSQGDIDSLKFMRRVTRTSNEYIGNQLNKSYN